MHAQTDRVIRASWLLAAALGSSACGGAAALPVHVNQVGYLPHSSKVAVIESDAQVPQPWKVTDATGKVVAQGSTVVRGFDPESGDTLHWADFSEVTGDGDGYRLTTGEEVSLPFRVGADVYRQLKYDSLAYFYHNRSGIRIELPYAREERWTRRAGHLSDRSVSYLGNEQPYTLDVRGGWYDAGDHGKYVVNGGIAVWTLQNLYERALHRGGPVGDFADGTLSIPERNNGFPDLLDEIRWEVEFLLRMQVPAGRPHAGMVHHKVHDASWSPIPFIAPEEWEERFLHRPSTAATLNLVAVAAQAARIWRKLDPKFARRCLRAATRAWNAARKHPDLLASSADSQGGGPYDDSRVDDEQYWAAAEMYLSLDERRRAPLLAYLRSSPQHGRVSPTTGHERIEQHSAMTWQSTAALGAISLVVVPSDLPEAERSRIRNSLVRAADRYLGLAKHQGYRVPFGAGTDGHYPWGSNSFVANNAIILALAYDFAGERPYLEGVVQAMDYLLGVNPLNISYVAGYGSYAFENPHHRFWAHSKTSRVPPPFPGALAGGPNSKLQDPTSGNRLRGRAPQKCYIDHVEAWSVNEVAINWNAPLAWVAAFLDEKGRSERAASAASASVVQRGEQDGS